MKNYPMIFAEIDTVSHVKSVVSIFDVAHALGLTQNLRAVNDNEWRGPCPIHHGDNPNAFSLYANSNRWFCRTQCGVHGGSIYDLVMKANDWSGKEGFKLAHDWLKSRYVTKFSGGNIC